MSNRANSTDTQGTTQTQAGNVTPINTWVTTFPRPAGQTILVTRASQGASVNDNVERDSDGGFWDTTAGVNVAPENTNVGINDMLSN
jgi:hypothetical protein